MSTCIPDFALAPPGAFLTLVLDTLPPRLSAVVPARVVSGEPVNVAYLSDADRVWATIVFADGSQTVVEGYAGQIAVPTIGAPRGRASVVVSALDSVGNLSTARYPVDVLARVGVRDFAMDVWATSIGLDLSEAAAFDLDLDAGAPMAVVLIQTEAD